ncbi:MAG: hypothetical protein A2506_05320 [Elusimicrobia bacterium RIFOXYD12_FULL_66_9]|nr:MAG: hypothetical protein A2506_05320 [Elusimicrobia bacterium RIFOXYD12_FULL_66_9]
MTNQEKGGGLLLFLTGAAIGAVCGILFAPRSGTETREDIADWLKERREKGSELIHRVKDESASRKDALVAAAKAAKSTYTEVNAKHHHDVAA